MVRGKSLRLGTYLFPLRDPRVRGRCKHRLLDIVIIAVCACICGCNDWQQVEVFARKRKDWLQSLLPLRDGVPSHDTFERVFDALDPVAFQQCFRDWIKALADGLGIKHIAIDGKTLRHSGSSSSGVRCLHLVSAWATEAHLSLGQVAVEAKSNEITAIPKLLELLDLHGAFVTIDAMGCQKEIARTIVDGGGNYTLTVKDNQSNLLEDIQNALAAALDVGPGDSTTKLDMYETVEAGHGRQERRLYTVLQNPTGIRHLKEWAGLCVIGMCSSERTMNGKTTDEVRYFIGSAPESAQHYGKVLRNHWGIENTLHWQLDVEFREDDNRVQKRHGAENLALLRRMTLSLLKQHPGKGSIACKRLEAALDPSTLEEILRCNSSNLGKD